MGDRYSVTMLFRVRSASGNNASTIQIWLSAFWTVTSSMNLAHDVKQHKMSGTIFHGVCLLIFVTALAFHVYFFFNGSIDLNNDSLTIKQGISPLTLPYTSVVNAGPAFTSAGKMMTHVVEIEIARISPDIYPHEYRKVYLRDPDAFLDALRSHLKQPA